MEKLKKYLTFNIYALFGYIIIGFTIYYLIKGNIENIILGLVFYGTFLLIEKGTIFLQYFLCAFLLEIIMTFIFKKIFKKDLFLNINNPYYDFLFRLGFLFSLTPIILIGTPILWMIIAAFLESIIGTFDIFYGKISKHIFFILCYTISFDFFIKLIFKNKLERKY